LARPIRTRKTAKAKERAKRASTRVGDAQLALIAEATGIPIEDLKRGGR